jgi:hypothetical protein
MPRTRWLTLLPLLLVSVIHAADQDKPIGNAWSDARNPVVARFKGKRLDLWSLKGPQRAQPPEVRDPANVRNSIDRFLLAELAAKGLTPNPDADRKTLIRRLSFDLTGLPPTPEEVRAFRDDPRPDAYERLVDRLLASEHYGERWGRHWLDVMRYSDSNGFERDEFRPAAWRYRDYIIKSFNDDKPFDQFLREQLAGDEMAADRADAVADEQRIATGFLRVGPWDSTKDTNLDSPVLQRDEMLTDVVNTTVSGFLGLTFTCCRCHDHKFDPFLQTDHFRLRAYFGAIQFQDYPLQATTQGRGLTDTRIAELERQRAPLVKELADLVAGPSKAITARREARLRAIVRLFVSSGFANDREAFRQAVAKLQQEVQRVEPDRAAMLLHGEEKKHYEKLKGDIGQIDARKNLGRALGVKEDVAKVAPTVVYKSGDFRKPLNEVKPGIPALFAPDTARIEAKRKTTGRRSALADWIAARQNPWTARVLVNRLWQHHFGKGLVATPDDFGYSGARPSNQALLDWLAVEFMDNGWSIKHMQRLMVTSAAYRRSSTIDTEKQRIDPDNVLLWRQNVQRLDAETLRDALLAVSGRMLPVAGGPPVWPEVPDELIKANPNIDEETDRTQGYYTDPGERCNVRSVFLVRKRSIPSPFLQAFNQPDPACTCGRRDVSIVAPQALMLLNDSFAVRMSRALADRLISECGSDARRQVERAFQLSLSRSPADEEPQIVLRELTRLRMVHAKDADVDRAALADVCLALLNTNEFIFVD